MKHKIGIAIRRTTEEAIDNASQVNLAHEIYRSTALLVRQKTYQATWYTTNLATWDATSIENDKFKMYPTILTRVFWLCMIVFVIGVGLIHVIGR